MNVKKEEYNEDVGEFVRFYDMKHENIFNYDETSVNHDMPNKI